MEIKKNLPLVVALGIPVVLTLVIAFAIYLPGFGAEPSYDFVYATGNYYGNGTTYDVVNGKVAEVPGIQYEETMPKPPTYTTQVAQLYHYDIETKTSKNITLEEAQAYRLETSRTSPDGYLIQNGSSSGFFPFYDRDNYYDQYLVGNNRRIKTTISDYDYDFAFLGWVLK
jgi:hypothetical protein